MNKAMQEVLVRRLEPLDDRTQFRSGNIDLDRFFLRYAVRISFDTTLDLAMEMRNRVGCIGVIVDAKPDAAPFYLSLGFKPIDLVSGALNDRPEPIAMFLPIGQIALATKEATD